MKARTTRFVTAVLLLFALLVCVNGEGNGQILPADLTEELSTRTHETWEGVYTFRAASVIRIEGLRDLYAVEYRCEGQEGVLLDFAVVQDNGTLRFLHEAQENVKGVTPSLEGIDVFPLEGAAEIIVRWRHPGTGGHRRVQKYLYEQTRMVLADQAEFMGKGMGMKWVKSER